MKVKSIIILMVGLYFCGHVFAQKVSDPAWGKIPWKHLTMTECPYDVDADAVILDEYGSYEFVREMNGYEVHNYIHIRIKILKEGGLSHANQVIRFQSWEKSEKVFALRAQTLNQEGGKIVAYKVKKNGVAVEEYSKEFKVKKFTFPRAQVGSILEFSYIHSSDRFFSPPEWKFQHDIPTLQSTLVPNIPGVLGFAYLYEGRKSEEFKKAGNDHFRLTNLPALKEEPFITTLEDYREKVQFQLIEYHSGGRLKKWLSTWEGFTKGILNGNYKPYLESSSDIKETVASIIGTETDPIEKIKKIHHYIVETYTFNGKRGAYPRKSQIEFLGSKVGSSGEINLTLVNMLNEAGVEAYPMMSSTRSFGVVPKGVPLIDRFNQILCCAFVDEDPIIINATHSYRPYDMPAIQDLNGRGWLMDKKNPRWVDFPNSYIAQKRVSGVLTLNSEGEITGNLNHTFKDYEAYRMRNIYLNDGEEEFKKYIFRNLIPEEGIKEIEIKNVKDTYENLVVTASLKTRNKVMQTGDMMYINPLLIFIENENPFSSKERHYPIDFAYRSRNEYVLTLNLPEGYSIESFPESVRISLEDKSMSYLFICQAEEGQIQIRSKISYNKPKFSHNEYSAIRQLYDLMIARQGEQIVLKKNK